MCNKNLLTDWTLQPHLDSVQGGGGDGVDAPNIAVQVFPNEHHVKVAQVETDALQVNQIHLYANQSK